MTAAGQSVEPFWGLYRQHLMPKNVPGASQEEVPKDHVAQILGPLQIGWLDPTEAAKIKTKTADDPYVHEPARHPALLMLSETPCSAESPPSLMSDSWITCNELFFVRNHHPVPVLNEAEFTLEVSSAQPCAPRRYPLPRCRVATRCCSTAASRVGARRRGQVSGLALRPRTLHAVICRHTPRPGERPRRQAAHVHDGPAA